MLRVKNSIETCGNCWVSRRVEIVVIDIGGDKFRGLVMGSRPLFERGIQKQATLKQILFSPVDWCLLKSLVRQYDTRWYKNWDLSSVNFGHYLCCLLKESVYKLKALLFQKGELRIAYIYTWIRDGYPNYISVFLRNFLSWILHTATVIRITSSLFTVNPLRLSKLNSERVAVQNNKNIKKFK